MSDVYSNRNQCGDCSDACTDRHRDEAGGDEQTGVEQVPRKKLQGQIDGGVDCSDLPCRLGECTSQNEYPYHQEDVLVAGALCEYGDPFLQRTSAADAQCVYRCYEKG